MGVKKVLYSAGATTAVVAAILAGSVAVNRAFAQAGPSASRGTPTTETQRVLDFLNALAARLSKTPAELLAAFRAAEHDMVNQDLQAGRITSQEAALRNQLIDQAAVPQVIDDDFGEDDDGDWDEIGDRFALAQFLGVPRADLRMAQRLGKSLAQLAQERGKTRDQLKGFLIDQQKARLDQRVLAGRLTRQGADLRLADFVGQLDRRIDRVEYDD
jgi:AraC-like DNA-binding protein